MANATPWYLTPEALAIIARIEVRPEVELVRDVLSAGDAQLCYVGADVDAIEQVFVAKAVAPYLVFPADALAALFGPADPSRVFADNKSKWALIAGEVRAVLAAQEAAFAHFEAARYAIRKEAA